MQEVLRQLVGQTVILATIADAPNVAPLFFLFNITSVNDFLVTVTDPVSTTTFVVNISDVIGVGFSLTVPPLTLIPPADLGCECDCRERPIRELLDTLIGSTVNLLVSNGSMATGFNVEQTALGIVIGTLPIPINPPPPTLFRFAISTCKITAVDITPLLRGHSSFLSRGPVAIFLNLRKNIYNRRKMKNSLALSSPCWRQPHAPNGYKRHLLRTIWPRCTREKTELNGSSYGVT